MNIPIVYAEKNGLVYATSPDMPGLLVVKKNRKAVDAELPGVVAMMRREGFSGWRKKWNKG